MRTPSSNALSRRSLRAILATTIAAAFISGCDVEQTREGELPDVDVAVDAGQMPAYEVNWADVDVGTREATVEVPKLVIVEETETITVPYIDMTMPGEDDTEERTIAVELELVDEAGELDIQSIYANERRLFVISRLERNGQSLQDQRIRVSDQLQLNASEDLDIRHIIVGARPEGAWNQQHRFVPSMAAARGLIGNDARELFTS